MLIDMSKPTTAGTLQRARGGIIITNEIIYSGHERGRDKESIRYSIARKGRKQLDDRKMQQQPD